MAVSQIAWNPIFRANSRDVAYGNYSYPYKEEMDKRRLFLQSYQFCRKKTMTERIRCSFFRVKRVVFIGRLRSAKIRRILCFFRNIRFGNFLISIRRRMFVRLHNSSYNYGKKIRRSRFSCLL